MNKLVETGQELETGYKHLAEKSGHWGQVFDRHLWAHRVHRFHVISLFLFFVFLTGQLPCIQWLAN